MLATDIIKSYQGRKPLFICLLRGGAPFSTRLMFAIAAKDPYFHPELDYMTVRTYGSELKAKPPEIIMDLSPSTDLDTRSVVLLDDILDTGTTASFVSDELTKRGAPSVDICILVRKQRPQSPFAGQILAGFTTPPEWQTGMGLDDPRICNEANRWAGYIALANEEV